MSSSKLFLIAFVVSLLVAGCEGNDNSEGSPFASTVKDIDGNVYRTVKIGDQTWMAENLRVTRYDTKSERWGVTLEPLSVATEKPYHADPARKAKEYYKEEPSVPAEKFGYLYNWTAAVGLPQNAWQALGFSTKRQGICPNGWHMPTEKEWQILVDRLETAPATRLKSTQGWSKQANGTDDFKMAVFPVGYAVGDSIYNMGNAAYFWTSDAYSAYEATHFFLYNTSTDVKSSYDSKTRGVCVRCLKDN